MAAFPGCHLIFVRCEYVCVHVLVCECKWPQVFKCHRDRDQKKFVPVSNVTTTTPPTPPAGLWGWVWDVVRVKHAHRGHSQNRFQGDGDFNSKRRLWWSGRGSTGVGPSATHQTSYTWVTHIVFLRTPPTYNPHLFQPPTTQITSVIHAWPIHPFFWYYFKT